MVRPGLLDYWTFVDKKETAIPLQENHDMMFLTFITYQDYLRLFFWIISYFSWWFNPKTSIFKYVANVKGAIKPRPDSQLKLQSS